MTDQPPTHGMICFTVYGKPASQGSKKAFLPPGQKNPVVVESAGDKLKAWRAAITQAAGAAMVDLPVIEGPVSVRIDFYFQRPKSHFRSGRNSHLLKAGQPELHIQKPDIDKLTRSTLDGLTRCCYRDDSQVMTLAATKHWTVSGTERAVIEVEEITSDDKPDVDTQATLFPEGVDRPEDAPF